MREMRDVKKKKKKLKRYFYFYFVERYAWFTKLSGYSIAIGDGELINKLTED